MNVSRRGFVRLAGGALGAMLLAGCSGAQDGGAAGSAAGSAEGSAAAQGLDYLVLVNKQNKLPDTWEATVELVEEESLLYDDPVRVEKRAYDAYREMRAALEAEDVHVELDSCYRSVAEQQEVWDSFMEEYGEEYTRTYVAVPGYSEHHTGLALDLFLVIDGEQVYLNEDMVKHTDVWAKIHAKLADYGFILRYLEGKEDVTGYGYEPWHIRYVGSPEVAHEIMDAGITLEEYLGEGAPAADYEVDYGVSEVYSQEDMDAAIAVIMAEFGGWEGCTESHFFYQMCGPRQVARPCGHHRQARHPARPPAHLRDLPHRPRGRRQDGRLAHGPRRRDGDAQRLRERRPDGTPAGGGRRCRGYGREGPEGPVSARFVKRIPRDAC